MPWLSKEMTSSFPLKANIINRKMYIWKQYMKQLPLLTSSIIIGVSVIVATFLASQTYSQLKRQEIDNLARHQCAQNSRYQVNSGDGVTVWYPIEDMYQSCLIEMGVENSEV